MSDELCRVNLVSSRMCERGTKGCEVEHCTTCGHTSDLHSPGSDYLCRGGAECRCQFFTTAPAG